MDLNWHDEKAMGSYWEEFYKLLEFEENYELEEIVEKANFDFAALRAADERKYDEILSYVVRKNLQFTFLKEEHGRWFWEQGYITSRKFASPGEAIEEIYKAVDSALMNELSWDTLNSPENGLDWEY